MPQLFASEKFNPSLEGFPSQSMSYLALILLRNLSVLISIWIVSVIEVHPLSDALSRPGTSGAMSVHPEVNFTFPFASEVSPKTRPTNARIFFWLNKPSQRDFGINSTPSDYPGCDALKILRCFCCFIVSLVSVSRGPSEMPARWLFLRSCKAIRKIVRGTELTERDVVFHHGNLLPRTSLTGPKYPGSVNLHLFRLCRTVRKWPRQVFGRENSTKMHRGMQKHAESEKKNRQVCERVDYQYDERKQNGRNSNGFFPGHYTRLPKVTETRVQLSENAREMCWRLNATNKFHWLVRYIALRTFYICLASLRAMVDGRLGWSKGRSRQTMFSRFI